MQIIYPSGYGRVSTPLRAYRGDRWVDVHAEIASDLLSLHREAITGLAMLHGWAGGPPDQPDEQALQRVLAAQPPPGWPERLSPVRYRLRAMDRSRSVAATEQWTVDPNRLDLGLGVFEKLVRDRLSGLPQPLDGSIVVHAEALVHQQLLVQTRMRVAVGIPRPKPLSSRDQVEMTRIRTEHDRVQYQRMCEMMGHGGDIIQATAGAIQVSGDIDYPRPVAPPAAGQKARAEEAKAVERAATRAVMDHVLPPESAASSAGEAPVGPPAGGSATGPRGRDD